MKIICVIPARAESSRFFEKPLAPISGKPMIRWVWEHCREVKEFDAVYVATDSEKIKEAAESFGAEVIMTASDHDTATERLYEVSRKVDADLYVMVNGDEPLLTREAIVQCIPPDLDPDSLFVSNLMTDFSNPVEVVDATNLKIVTAADNRCLFISRSPIPYPKGSLDVIYHKFVGVGAFTRKALHSARTYREGRGKRFLQVYREPRADLLLQRPLQIIVSRHSERHCRGGEVSYARHPIESRMN